MICDQAVCKVGVGNTYCNDIETNTSDDVSHYGSCSHRCDNGKVCTNGECVDGQGPMYCNDIIVNTFSAAIIPTTVIPPSAPLYGYAFNIFVAPPISLSLNTAPHARYMHTRAFYVMMRVTIETCGPQDVYDINAVMDREYFGFTKEEVKEMLSYYDLSERYDDIQNWYDGYLFGERHVYNPFSLVLSVKNLVIQDKNAIRSYWTNSSGNDIIRDILLDHRECSDDIQKLIKNQSIYKPIRESMTYRDLDSYDDYIWTLLYYTGYIKSVSRQQIDEDWIYELKLVNKEIKAIFPEFIRLYLRESVRQQGLSKFYQAIWNKDAVVVKQFIKSILMGMVSYHDTKEMFYHGMMLGILSNFTQCELKSNREDGLARTDIVLRDNFDDRAIIFEFKWDNDRKLLKKLPEIAIKQVRDHQYAEALHEENYDTVMVVGIGFCEKSCDVVIEEM